MRKGPERPVDSIAAGSGDGEETLTLAEVAELLQCSRPHAAMLIDAGDLTAAMNGREPRVTRASVVAYAQTRVSGGDADYKQAARDAGMYEVPDQVYVEELARKRSPKLGER